VNRANFEATIDELARRTGLTTRTIRAHQTAGLLPPPRRRGRTAYYGDEHTERLAAITRLQARGWSRAAIRDALAACDAGRPLADLLGLPPGPPAVARPSDWVDELFAAYVVPAEAAALLPAPLSN
jgi:DNA-binding transcriptional MerR regulator